MGVSDLVGGRGFRWGGAVAVFAAALFLGACGSPEEGSESAATPEAPSPELTSARTTPAPNDSFAGINQLLEAGQFDDAAARLLEMRVSGKEFGEKEAAEYRDALEAAYAKALEAAQNGDPRGQATLQMIRAATAR